MYTHIYSYILIFTHICPYLLSFIQIEYRTPIVNNSLPCFIMIVKSVTMAEMRKSGAIPKSPTQVHQERVGKGNYNRFKHLQDKRDRSQSEGKRQRGNSDEVFEVSTTKAPRLDEDLLVSQMARAEQELKAAKTSMDECLKVADGCYSANDGQMGTAFYKLTEVVKHLITNQEWITSTVADSRKLADQVSKEQDKVNSKMNNVMSYAGAAQGRGTEAQGKKQTKPPPSEEEKSRKRIWQAINKAEKSSILFGVNMGEVPTINKETLARKLTLDLHKKAKASAKGSGAKDAKYTEKQVEEITDDLLTCASLDFLGTGTKLYKNKFNESDANNGKFCTMPVKMMFKDKKERILAEQHLRKVCDVKCSTPYPKGLRALISGLINNAKKEKPGRFILAKVNAENLTVSALASKNNRWVDLDITKEIPLNILDRFEQMEADSDMEAENETEGEKEPCSH
jgi:hypothetical protein